MVSILFKKSDYERAFSLPWKSSAADGWSGRPKSELAFKGLAERLLTFRAIIYAEWQSFAKSRFFGRFAFVIFWLIFRLGLDLMTLGNSKHSCPT